MSVSAPKLAGVQTEAGRPRPAAGRAALVSRLLLDALPSVLPPGGRRPAVLDCGGGSGTFAVPLARAGADVTVIDISADALATLHRRADEAGVSGTVRALPGDVEALGDLVPPGSFDLVLAHGILDAVDAVELTFDGIAAATRHGGLISFLVGNPNASVLARAIAGELALALIELRELDAAGPAVTPGRTGPEAVTALCAGRGLAVESRHGIGVFSDLVPGSALDTPAAREALAELDFEAAGRDPFAALAARIHLLVRVPGPDPRHAAGGGTGGP
jgi:SAM-dependent methyltransferase